jgi:hypothetical protein
VKLKDEEKYGEYRTEPVILEIYDEMTEASQIEDCEDWGCSQASVVGGDVT